MPLTERVARPAHTGRVRGLAIALLCVAGTAQAESSEHQLYDRLFPRVPDGRHLTLSQQITDQLTLLGNTIGQHVDVLSHETIGLRFDGRRRRAYVRLGAGSERYLNFAFASNIHFTQGMARIDARIQLSVAGRAYALRLPEVEMVPASYRGERGVEIRVPLFKRSF